MKGLLVLQRRFTLLGHELALLLKERHGIDQFCCFTFTRDCADMLSSQKDVAYSSILVDEDVHEGYKNEVLDHSYLSEIEEEYGNLWNFIEVDRIVRHGQLVREYPYDAAPYTHEEMLRIVQAYAKRLIAFFDREKPDFVFTYQPASVGAMLIYAIAKKRGIPVFVTINPMTRSLVSISERYDRVTGAEDVWRSYLTLPASAIPTYSEAKKYLEEFRSAPVMYSKAYAKLIKHGKWKQFGFLKPARLVRTLAWIGSMSLAWWRNTKKRRDYTTVHPAYFLIDAARRKLRNFFGVEHLYDEYEKDKPFAFYPLHLEPELAILLLAPFDTDQIAIVRRLARSLPEGMLVYVKEHPQMTPFRPRSFYRELKKIPNVRLIRPEVSGFELIRNSRLVATISSAAGWEAVLFGKPLVTFGEVFYNAIPTVARSRTPDELPAVIRRQLQTRHDDETVVRFIAALLEDGAQCDLSYLWEIETDRAKKREGLLDFAAMIARKVKQAQRSRASSS